MGDLYVVVLQCLVCKVWCVFGLVEILLLYVGYIFFLWENFGLYLNFVFVGEQVDGVCQYDGVDGLCDCGYNVYCWQLLFCVCVCEVIQVLGQG